MRQRRSRLMIIGLMTLAGVAVVLLAGLKLTSAADQEIGDAPSWLHAEDIQFTSINDSIIKGWYYSPSDPKATVVLLHPLRGNRQSMLGRARFLIEAGLAVLLIDFQAHGESQGERITFGYLESGDASAAVEYARSRHADLPVIVLGRSLGGAAAVLADPPLIIDGLILEAVFPTIEVAVENRLRLRFGSVGAALTPALTSLIGPGLGIRPNQLAPIDHVSSVRAPVFVVSGQEDKRTTEMDTMQLYERIRADKTLWLVAGATHQDLHAYAAAEYEKRLLLFISDCCQVNLDP